MSLAWQMLRFIIVDFILQTVYFPLWWYSVGTYKILKAIYREIKEFAYSLNLSILFKNLLNPMYGLNDFFSRLISFFVRIAYFFIILIITIIWIMVLIVIFILWLIAPWFILYNLLFQMQLVDYNLYALIL